MIKGKINMGFLDRFKSKEDPEEKTFHDIVDKKAKTEGRQAYSEGYTRGVRERERERGKLEGRNPQAKGMMGHANNFLDSINTNNVLFSGGSGGSMSSGRPSFMDSPFGGSSKKKKQFDPAASPFE